VHEVADALKAEGMRVEAVRPEGMEGVEKALGGMGDDGGAWVKRLIDKAGTKDYGDNIKSWVSIKPTTSAQMSLDLEILDEYRSKMLRFMQSHDVVLCPVESYSAPTPDEMMKKKHVLTYTLPFNATGWPAAVVRAGASSNGMPIGVQIVARPW